MQLNHGYISHSFKDNYGRVAILTARANLSDYIVFPHAYSLPRTVRTLVMVRKFISVFREKWDPGYIATFEPILPISGLMVPTAHPTCRFTDVTNDIPPDDDLGGSPPLASAHRHRSRMSLFYFYISFVLSIFWTSHFGAGGAFRRLLCPAWTLLTYC